MTTPLTDSRIRAATEKDSPLLDGKGLSLVISKTGLKSWRYRYEIDGKENIFTIGRYCKPVPNEQ